MRLIFIARYLVSCLSEQFQSALVLIKFSREDHMTCVSEIGSE